MEAITCLPRRRFVPRAGDYFTRRRFMTQGAGSGRHIGKDENDHDPHSLFANLLPLPNGRGAPKGFGLIPILSQLGGKSPDSAPYARADRRRGVVPVVFDLTRAIKRLGA